MSDEETMPMGDPPAPALPVLEQREMPPLAAVPVEVCGPVRVQPQPARTAVIDEVHLGTTAAHVLAADNRRARAVLICSVAWEFRLTRSGPSVAWPADVPLELLSVCEIWATCATPETPLTVLAEMYAQ